jgi:hypothetical protein
MQISHRWNRLESDYLVFFDSTFFLILFYPFLPVFLFSFQPALVGVDATTALLANIVSRRAP